MIKFGFEKWDGWIKVNGEAFDINVDALFILGRCSYKKCGNERVSAVERLLTQVTQVSGK